MTEQNQTIRKYGQIAAGAAAITLGAADALTNLLVHEALDRKEPALPARIRQKMLRVKKARKPAAPSRETVYPILEQAERVSISAWDGTELVGHWLPCPEEKRVILAMHGWRSSWSRDFGALADFWRENGCSVLFAEQRAQGESGGDTIGFGLLERYDCLDWLDWLNTHGCRETPIYLMGISMGATTVLMAAGLELPDNVHGIMADCGFTSPEDIFRHVMRSNLHLSYGPVEHRVNAKCRRRIGARIDSVSTIDAMETCDRPVLFIHGTEDTFVPIGMTWDNYKACAAPKRLLVVPGARHGQSSRVDRQHYQQAMLDFWRDFDSARPASAENNATAAL